MNRVYVFQYFRNLSPPVCVRTLRFDVVLDGVGGETEQWAMGALKPWSGAKYVTLVTPLLLNTDSMGLLQGTFHAGFTLHSMAIQVNISKTTFWIPRWIKHSNNILSLVFLMLPLAMGVDHRCSQYLILIGMEIHHCEMGKHLVWPVKVFVLFPLRWTDKVQLKQGGENRVITCLHSFIA